MRAVLDAARLDQLRHQIAVDQLLDSIVHDEPKQAAAYWMDTYHAQTSTETIPASPAPAPAKRSRKGSVAAAETAEAVSSD